MTPSPYIIGVKPDLSLWARMPFHRPPNNDNVPLRQRVDLIERMSQFLRARSKKMLRHALRLVTP